MFYFWVGILLCSPNNGMSKLKFPLSIMSVFDPFTSRLNLITSSYFYFTNFLLFFSKSKLRRSTVRVSIFYVNLFRQQAAFHRSLALSYSGLHFLGCQASFHQFFFGNLLGMYQISSKPPIFELWSFLVQEGRGVRSQLIQLGIIRGSLGTNSMAFERVVLEKSGLGGSVKNCQVWNFSNFLAFSYRKIPI